MKTNIPVLKLHVILANVMIFRHGNEIRTITNIMSVDDEPAYRDETSVNPATMNVSSNSNWLNDDL